MKKLISLIVVFSLILSMTGVSFAAAPVVESQTVVTMQLNDEMMVERTLTVYRSLGRAYVKSASVTDTYTATSGEKAAVVTLNASFSYDGNTARVLSSYSDVSEYNSWTYGNERIRESNNTTRLTARLSKSGKTSQSVNMSISCSPDGTIIDG